MFQLVGDKPFLKRRGQGHVTNFRILHPMKNIFGTANATDFKFCARFGHEKY